MAEPPKEERPAQAPAQAVPQKIEMDSILSSMVSVMTTLIGGLAATGSANKPLTLDDLPKWLEDNAAVARKIIEEFPQPKEETAGKPADPVSEDQWKLVVSKKNGKILGILPENDVAERWFSEEPEQEIVSKKAISSYDAAVDRCRKKIESIIKDCERKNQKFRDLDFALDDHDVCLRSLVEDPDDDTYSPPPQGVARTRGIFPSPQMFVNGANADDVRQGYGGDCWFLAGIAALTNLKEGLNHNYVQVDGDEKVGVYGFVFHRDGEWVYEIVDDFLYLKNPVQGHLNLSNMTDTAAPGFYYGFESRLLRNMDEEKYRKTFLSGADALYFSQSRDDNEIWLPLLEKAYAKAHGDYMSIDGGFTGEAIEDLTGGITTEIKTEDILDLDRMWEELLRCNQEFIFGCWTPGWPDARDTSQGLFSGHAYSIMQAQDIEIEGKARRLVLVRNPWGNSEWTGPFSDGSKEWTVDLIQRLNHRFGDDGVFWMSYEDLLAKFTLFDRTRLIGPEWSCAQCWTNLAIPRQFRFQETKFAFSLDKEDRTVISLSQLDDRYIRGLEGPYTFMLEFRLEKDGEGEILARSSSSYSTSRSVNSELDLAAGTYSLYLKIKANNDLPREKVNDASKKFLKENTMKFIQIAKKYNLAFMKSGLGDEERETKPLDLSTPVTPAKEETPKPSASPRSTDGEAPLSPVARGMEDVKDIKDQVVVSTDGPVEIPVTAEPEAIKQTEEKPDANKSDEAAKTEKPKDDWDAIATVGLRLLTRNATVKLSIVTPDPPKEPRILLSRQSYPVGNIPPVPGVTPEPSNTTGSTTSSKEGVPTPESEKDKAKADEPAAKEDAPKEEKEAVDKQALVDSQMPSSRPQSLEVIAAVSGDTASGQPEQKAASEVKFATPSIDSVIDQILDPKPPAATEQQTTTQPEAPKGFQVRF